MLLPSGEILCIISFAPAGVMELVDVADSKSADGDIVGVRVPPPAPLGMTGFLEFERPSFFVASGQFSPEFSPVTPRSHRVSWIPGEILSTLLILDAEVLFAAVSR